MQPPARKSRARGSHNGALRFDLPGHAHLVGAGGSGMRSLAAWLAARGWKLSGSDASGGESVRLANGRLKWMAGHAAEQVPAETTLVIASSAIAEDNPECVRARERKLRVLSYTEVLAQLIRGRHGIAVAGTHGKSTTTAMLGEILELAGLDPTYVFGAQRIGGMPGARAGDGELVVVEACEYQRNFLRLSPRMALLHAVEADHFDCFPTAADTEAAFAEFLALLPVEGLALVSAECPTASRLASEVARCPVRTFGLAPRGDWSADELSARRGRYAFSIRRFGRDFARVALRVPGRFQVMNALAAAAAAGELGVSAETIAAALAGFQGLARRLESLGHPGGLCLYEDYAHHPTALAACLTALREMHPGRQIACVFQPHQIQRTERLLDDFARSLQNTDRLLVLDVFPAREPVQPAVRTLARALADRVAVAGRPARHLAPGTELAEAVREGLRPGDVLALIGAGDLRRIRNGIVERLRSYRAAG